MMHIHNGTLAAQGPVGVNLHQSNAALNAKSGLTMYIPIDASALVKDVYPDMAAFAKVGGRMGHQQRAGWCLAEAWPVAVSAVVPL